jgi:hypothetical protein
MEKGDVRGNGTRVALWGYECCDRVTVQEHDPEKWEPVFGTRSCSNKELERDDDSKKNHPVPAESG